MLCVFHVSGSGQYNGEGRRLCTRDGALGELE